ncbi:exopolysaccharide biosynthesis protein, partial [Aerococcus mictus]
LLLKSNIYLDINYGVEVEDIVTKANNLGLAVYSFEGYCHQVDILDPNNIFVQENYQDLINQIKCQEDRVKK